MSGSTKEGLIRNPETGNLVIAYKSELYLAIMDAVISRYGDSGLKSLLRYAEILGMDSVTSRRSTNEALIVFIAQKLGEI